MLNYLFIIPDKFHVLYVYKYPTYITNTIIDVNLSKEWEIKGQHFISSENMAKLKFINFIACKSYSLI